MCGNTRVGYRRFTRIYARGFITIPISVLEGYESQSVRTVGGMTFSTHPVVKGFFAFPIQN